MFQRSLIKSNATVRGESRYSYAGIRRSSMIQVDCTTITADKKVRYIDLLVKDIVSLDDDEYPWRSVSVDVSSTVIRDVSKMRFI